jgi:RNA polymerase sigma-70 factor (ECF subfamily)
MLYRRPGIEIDDHSDEVLLAGFGARRGQHVIHFVRRFQASIYGVALAIVRDIDLAEDVATHTFVRAQMQAISYDPGRGSVRGWLLRIAHDLAVEAVRERRPVPVDPRQLHTMLGDLTGTGADRERTVEKPASAPVGSALAALPMEQARAVILAVAYGLTGQEIADYEDVPASTAMHRILAGLQKLHQPPRHIHR